MIKINLLQHKRRKKARKIPSFVMAGLGLLLLAVIVTFFFDYSMKGRLASLKQQKASNDAKLAMLQSKIAEVQKFEKLNEKFDQRKQIIEQLRQNQALPVKILDEISTRLTDGVWLSALGISPAPSLPVKKIKKGPAKPAGGGVADNIQMSGFGYTNDDIVQFVQSLKGSALFTDVYLVGTSKSSISGVEVYSFSLTMKVKSNG